MGDPVKELPFLIERGLTLADCIAAFGDDGPKTGAILEAAGDHRLVEGGVLEIDDNAILSASEDEIEPDEDGRIGGYVLAWLWVETEYDPGE